MRTIQINKNLTFYTNDKDRLTVKKSTGTNFEIYTFTDLAAKDIATMINTYMMTHAREDWRKKDWLPIDYAAKDLGTTTAAIRQRIRRGKWPLEHANMIGRTWHVTPESIEAAARN